MQQYKDIIQHFSTQKILVIGDAMLDVYIQGYSNRLCREAPVPIVSVFHEEKVPGGAANTAMNVAALGGTCIFLSVIGNDESGRALLNILKANNVITKSVIVDATRETLSKQRVLSEDQLVVRFDFGSTKPVDPYIEFIFMQQLQQVYKSIDAIVISDYEYGVLSNSVIEQIGKLQKKYNKKLIIDAKTLEKYACLHPTVVKPNYSEVARILHTSPARSANRVDFLLERHVKEKLFFKTNAQIVALTLDTDGAIILQKNSLRPYRTYSKPVANVKAAGAGDTYTSALALALCANEDIYAAAEIAAAACSVVIKKEGTVACSTKELIASLTKRPKEIQSVSLLKEIVAEYKKQGKRIVFTNGCFDILHGGHVSYLHAAKELGDILIVGINSDKSIKRLKGGSRPINALKDRMLVLSGLSCIDHIIPFEEDTPSLLIQNIQPDVFVKGGDYQKDTIPEAKLVEALGGVVRILPYIPDHSTTNIINKIAKGGVAQAQTANI